MKAILIKTCFECPFCTPGVFTENNIIRNSYKCRHLGIELSNERTIIDSRCELKDIDENKINQLDVLKQAYLDMEDDLDYNNDNDVEGKEKEKIIYDFLGKFIE